MGDLDTDLDGLARPLDDLGGERRWTGERRRGEGEAPRGGESSYTALEGRLLRAGEGERRRCTGEGDRRA